MSAPQKLSILEHLRELRSRFIKSLLALVLGTGVAAAFTFPVMDFLKKPAGDVTLVYIDPTELITTYFKVAILGGLILAMPIVLYQMAMFAAPGLTSKEKRYMIVSLPGIVISFMAGAVFTWFILLPPAFHFLLNFGEGVAEPQIRISRYINLILVLTTWVGLSFQTPLVMTLLARLGVVKPSSFAKKRKMAIIGAFIAAAIFTPTFDPINQTLLASPIIVLYEMGIWLSKLANRRRLKSAEQRMLELNQ